MKQLVFIGQKGKRPVIETGEAASKICDVLARHKIPIAHIDDVFADAKEIAFHRGRVHKEDR